MRRSGKTTRTVDEAIQKLFNQGEIWIPTMSGIKHMNEKHFPKEKKEQLMKFSVIDDEWELSQMVQKHLEKRIVNRLMIEHQQQCSFSKKDSHTVIKLINP